MVVRVLLEEELLRTAELLEEVLPVERFTCAALERCWVWEDRTALDEELRVELPEELLLTEDVLLDEELPEVVELERLPEVVLPLRRA